MFTANSFRALLVLGVLLPTARTSPRAEPQANRTGPAAGQVRFIIPTERKFETRIELTAGGHIFVPVRLKNSPPLWFILDSAGENTLVSARVAKEMSLKAIAVGSVTGSGEHSVQVRVIDHVDLELPGIEYSRNNVPAVPLESLEAVFGRRIDGILGYDFISQLVVEINYEDKLLTMYDPKTYRYSGGGREVPIKLVAGQPGVAAQVKLPGREPNTAFLYLDTGAGSTIDFYAPYVASEKLLAAVTRRVEVEGRGVGGDTPSYYGRINSLTVGNYTVEKPVAGFSEAHGGSMSGAQAAGLIGGKFFRRFKLIFDQPRDRIILEPNRRFRAPDLYDGIGARIMARGADFRTFQISQLVQGGPAEQSGLRQGDIVIAVNGVSASKMNVDQLRERLLQGNQAVSLTIRRGSGTVELRVQPVPLI